MALYLLGITPVGVGLAGMGGDGDGSPRPCLLRLNQTLFST